MEIIRKIYIIELGEKQLIKTKWVNIILILLFIIIIIINHYFDNLKQLGIALALLMVVLGIMKEKIIRKNNKEE